MNKRTNAARAFSLVLALLMVLGCFAGCAGGNASSASQPSSQASSAGDGSAVSAATKTITFEVVHKDGSKKDFDITTDAETLREALEKEKLIAGEESEYGMFVKTVDGETVDDANQEWWCLTIGGKEATTGVDSTKIEDGGSYEFTFTVGY